MAGEVNATTHTEWWPYQNSTENEITNHSVHIIGTLSTPVDPAIVRFRDDSRFWVQRVLLPIIESIGVFGNVITMLVLTRRGMRSSTNAYLTALAIADLIYLLCVFWLSLRHYPNFKDSTLWATLYAYSWPYSVWLTDATTNTSVWLTVTFTVERCIAVCLPIKGRVWCTESRAKRLIAVVYLICFTTTLSTPFEWAVVDVVDSSNVTRVEITPSRLGRDETYQTFYYWFTTISFVFVPLTLLIIFNSFLMHSVRQSNKLRQVMTGRQNGCNREDRAAHSEVKITTTLIAVVITFLICQLPTAATLIYKVFHEPKPQSDEEAFLQGLGNIFNFLVAVNAACNFLLYCAFSDKYRRAFIRAFCRCFMCCSRPVNFAISRLCQCQQNKQREEPLEVDGNNKAEFQRALVPPLHPRGELCAVQPNTTRQPQRILRKTAPLDLSRGNEAIGPLLNHHLIQHQQTGIAIGIGTSGRTEETPTPSQSSGNSRHSTGKKKWRWEQCRQQTGCVGNSNSNNVFVPATSNSLDHRASENQQLTPASIHLLGDDDAFTSCV